MATRPVTQFLQQVRTAALTRDAAGVPDETLLQWYVGGRDEGAFAALVRRHGPMVLGVCRRVLADRQAAEDAFQATFLVLIRKAGSLARGSSLGPWLYGVAFNVARKARSVAARRQAREKQVADLPERASAVPRSDVRECLPLLDQELSRLPDKYRLPIVLCDLQGKAHREVGELLGWPVGTVSGRLARGRALLARRLTRQGVGLSAGTLAVVLASQTVAAIPAAVTSSMLRAAALVAAGRVGPGVITTSVATLVEGALQSMLFARLKTAVVVMALGAGLAWGLLGYRTVGQPAVVAAEQRADDKSPADAKNLLRNGGMEEGTPEPAHWAQGGEVAGVTYSRDGKVGFKSKSSLCLHKTAERYFPIAQWVQVIDRQGDRPRLYVKAQVKAERLTKAILDVSFLDSDGEWKSHEWAAYVGAKEANDPPANHDWKEYAGTVKIPPGTKKIQVGLQIYGPGKVWFDDVHAEYAK